MNDLSFEPKYFVQTQNGEWALRHNIDSSLLAKAVSEGILISDEDGKVSRFTEGYPIAETPLNRGLVDAFE